MRELERLAAAGDLDAHAQLLRARERAGWPGLIEARDALVARLQRSFPVEPIPPYPEGLGTDPLGVDEYAPFAGLPWNGVPLEHLNMFGYDIPPTIGFDAAMWNYHLPGFFTAALLHADEVELVDSLGWELRDHRPPHAPLPPSIRERAWWFNGGYRRFTPTQLGCVAAYLDFMRTYGAATPYEYGWAAEDEAAHQAWRPHLDRDEGR
jgi:hypothetical protein